MLLHKWLLAKSTEEVNFEAVRIRQILKKFPEFYIIPKILFCVYESPQIVPIPNYIKSIKKPLIVFL